jgi:CheY-like chemotaxis protein
VTIRVLVVEDDPELRDVLVLALEQEGYQVDSAGNGVEAIVCLYFGARPDAVVLNLHMPVMSGAELLEVVRGDPALAALPVVVVTGAAAAPAVARAADAVLMKPFDLDALAGEIDRLVSGGRTSPPALHRAPP